MGGAQTDSKSRSVQAERRHVARMTQDGKGTSGSRGAALDPLISNMRPHAAALLQVPNTKALRDARAERRIKERNLILCRSSKVCVPQPSGKTASTAVRPSRHAAPDDARGESSKLVKGAPHKPKPSGNRSETDQKAQESSAGQLSMPAVPPQEDMSVEACLPRDAACAAHDVVSSTAQDAMEELQPSGNGSKTNQGVQKRASEQLSLSEQSHEEAETAEARSPRDSACAAHDAVSDTAQGTPRELQPAGNGSKNNQEVQESVSEQLSLFEQSPEEAETAEARSPRDAACAARDKLCDTAQGTPRELQPSGNESKTNQEVQESVSEQLSLFEQSPGKTTSGEAGTLHIATCATDVEVSDTAQQAPRELQPFGNGSKTNQEAQESASEQLPLSAQFHGEIARAEACSSRHSPLGEQINTPNGTPRRSQPKKNASQMRQEAWSTSSEEQPKAEQSVGKSWTPSKHSFGDSAHDLPSDMANKAMHEQQHAGNGAPMLQELGKKAKASFIPSNTTVDAVSPAYVQVERGDCPTTEPFGEVGDDLLDIVEIDATEDELDAACEMLGMTHERIGVKARNTNRLARLTRAPAINGCIRVPNGQVERGLSTTSPTPTPPTKANDDLLDQTEINTADAEIDEVRELFALTREQMGVKAETTKEKPIQTQRTASAMQDDQDGTCLKKDSRTYLEVARTAVPAARNTAIANPTLATVATKSEEKNGRQLTQLDAERYLSFLAQRKCWRKWRLKLTKFQAMYPNLKAEQLENMGNPPTERMRKQQSNTALKPVAENANDDPEDPPATQHDIDPNAKQFSERRALRYLKFLQRTKQEKRFEAKLEKLKRIYPTLKAPAHVETQETAAETAKQMPKAKTTTKRHGHRRAERYLKYLLKFGRDTLFKKKHDRLKKQYPQLKDMAKLHNETKSSFQRKYIGRDKLAEQENDAKSQNTTSNGEAVDRSVTQEHTVPETLTDNEEEESEKHGICC